MKSELIPVDTGRKAPYIVEITTQDVRIRGLPESLHGATFVQISDLHGGFGNTEAAHELALERVNALKPDLLLFTGDYVDDHANPRDYPMHETLKRFYRARLGVYGVFGNHEHRRGVVQARRLLEKSEIRLLENENICLEGGLWLAGLDDLFEGKPDIPRTFAGIPEEVTALVLSHHPRLLEHLTDRDAIILSGHTHGGQICLPFLPPELVCWIHLRCRQVAGWYENGRSRLYVNRGLGVTGKPFRYHCPAEIAIFHLLPASAE